MTSILNQTEINLLKRVASNLNIQDVKKGSYLNTLIRGLSELNKDTLNEVQFEIDSINIDTADATAIEIYGERKGVPRVKNHSISVLAKNGGLTVEVDFYNYVADEQYLLFEKGEKISSDIFDITFLEDVLYNSKFLKVFVSCTIGITENTANILKNLEAGSAIKLPIKSQFKNNIKALKLNLETNLIFSNYAEDLDVYRARIKQYMKTDNINNKSTLYTLFSQIPNISNYYVDETVIPNTVYLINNLMYRDVFFKEDLQNYSIPYAESFIDTYKSYTASFNFEVASSVTFSLNLVLPEDFSSLFFQDFNYFIINEHVLGSIYIINENLIQRYLNSKGLNVDFTYTLSLSFNGISFPPADGSNSIIVDRHEYPFLYSLSINEVVIDV